MGYWKMIKEYARAHLIAVWAVFSILFAIIIHFLFHWDSGPKWLEAKWNAGDILTYASTVALGLLALWQNKRFKEENDVSQKRLEKLTEQANSLTVVNKIIELESDRLRRLKTAIDAFSEACDPIGIISLFNPGDFRKKDGSLTIADINASVRIKSTLENVLFELGINASKGITDLGPFPNTLISYSQASNELIKKFSNSLTIETGDGLKCTEEDWGKIREQIDIALDMQKKFIAEKSILINRKEEMIDKIIYNDYSIETIKMVLKKEKNLDRYSEEVG